MDNGTSNNAQRKKAGESTFEMARKRRVMVLVIGIVAILISSWLVL